MKVALRVMRTITVAMMTMMTSMTGVMPMWMTSTGISIYFI